MNISEKNKKRIHLGFGIVISIMLVLVGILFISSCYSIYKSGSKPFTRESISDAFSEIAVWVYITLSLTIIGSAVCFALPLEKEKLKGARSVETVVGKLEQRIDLDKLETDFREKIERERKLRHILKIVRLILTVLSATLPLIFLLNPANFPNAEGKLNTEILHGILVYLAFLAPLFIFEVVFVIVRDLSYTREHSLLKEAVLQHGIAEVTDKMPDCIFCKAVNYIKSNQKPIVLGVRIAFVGCAVAFIIAGVINGGMADVLGKAIKICTECIGLG